MSLLAGSDVPQATFDKVVRKGALLTRGMPRFEELPRGEIAAVRQYIRSVAHRLGRSEMQQGERQ